MWINYALVHIEIRNCVCAKICSGYYNPAFMPTGIIVGFAIVLYSKTWDFVCPSLCSVENHSGPATLIGKQNRLYNNVLYRITLLENKLSSEVKMHC